MPAPRRAGPRLVRRFAEERWSWLDLRLVLPAGVLWVVTLAAAGSGARSQLAGVLGAGLVAALLSRSRRPAAGVALGCLAAVALGCAAGAVRADLAAASPLHRLAEQHATVPVVLRVADRPRPVGGAGPPRVLVPATVTRVDERDVRDQPVLVFGAATDWAGAAPASTVRLRASLRPAEAGDDVRAVLSARSPPELVAGPTGVTAVAGAVRRGLLDSAHRVLPPRPAGLLPGLVVGDTSAMDPALTADFRRAGLSHLTAVSGANVAVVLALVLWPLRARTAPRRVQVAVGMPALAGFVVLVGPQPSVLRAAAMGAVTLLALASGRSRTAVPALAAAVAVLLVVDPALASDGGFALSVAATAGIVLLSPSWSRALRRRGAVRPLADALAVSVAAGLVTAPLVAALSGTVSLVSLPANLVAAPAVAPATVLGLLAALVGPVCPPAGAGLTWLAGWPVRWLVVVGERAAALPDSAAAWPVGVAGALLLTALLGGVCWALVRRPRWRPLALAAVLGLVVVGWPLRQVARGWPLPDTVVVACDVGQGDALVLPTGPGTGVLVDAGPDGALVDACLRRLGIDHLPLVLLSHLDADHVGGLAGALAGRDVGAVATGTLAPTDDRAPRLDALVRRAGADRQVLVPGDRRTVGSAGFEVLAPDPALAVPGADANGLSMVVRATQRGVRVLFTGDLGAEAEARIAARTDLTADVLKVPHHGSADADRAFLAATSARVALVSVGADNPYGHPADRLLGWLAADGMQVHRTDRDGDVAVVGSAGAWGVAVRGPDAVQRALAGGAVVGAGAPFGRDGPGGRPGRAGTGSSDPRGSMAPWQRHLRHRRPGSGS